MNPLKCDELDYIHFLIAAQRSFTIAHDAFTGLLQRKPLDKEAFGHGAETFVDKKRGLLVLDDTTLDNPYTRKMDLVTWHWSGKHKGGGLM